MIQFIQSIWAIGWPLQFVMIIFPIAVVFMIFTYVDMRQMEGDLHKND